MPTYEFRCQGRCGVIEVTKRMSDPSPEKCPHCGRAGLERVYDAHFIGAVDAGQENENGGMGMHYPSLGPQFLDAKTKTKRNPEAHARSRYDAMEKLRRRGYGVEKA